MTNRQTQYVETVEAAAVFFATEQARMLKTSVSTRGVAAAARRSASKRFPAFADAFRRCLVMLYAGSAYYAANVIWCDDATRGDHAVPREGRLPADDEISDDMLA